MVIGPFSGRYRFLSNFYISPMLYRGRDWQTVEHLYQAAKTLNKEQRLAIWAAKSPGEAKKLGRKCEIRPDWEDIKYERMNRYVHLKFKNPILARSLLATKKHELVEINSWNDKIWGTCDGKGLNWLGEILMQIRHELNGI